MTELLSHLASTDSGSKGNCVFMKDTLTWTDIDGNERKHKLEGKIIGLPLDEANIKHIDLTAVGRVKRLKRLSLSKNQIEEIDLSPLSSCKNLETLILSNNHLKHVDLTPLGSCKKLKDLRLDNNQLEVLDFSVLGSCSDLRSIWVHANKLKNINFTGLGSCKNLDTIWAMENLLEEVDFGPLGSCSSLKALWFDKNEIREIDFRPLRTCENLESLRFGANQLQTIDLSPLRSCLNFGGLSLSKNQLTHLDLTPLREARRMRSLSLQHNQLIEIDLGPLSSSCDFTDVYLSDNELEHIDLSPLKSMNGLMIVELHNNRLRNIDLSVFLGKENLVSLTLSENELEEIDLSPLVFCRRLVRVPLRGNNLTSVDLTPLLPCYRMREYEVDSSMKAVSWLNPESFSCAANFILRDKVGRTTLTSHVPDLAWTILRIVLDMLFEHEESGRRYTGWCKQDIQFDTLRVLDLDYLGFPDLDLPTLLRSIRVRATLESARSNIKTKILSWLTNHIDKGGTAFGLNLERAKSDGEIAIRIEKLVEQRKSELISVSIPVVGEKVDLRPIWLSAWGFEILRSLELGLETDLQGVEQIKEAFKELDIELHMTGKPMSELEDWERYIVARISRGMI